jgi:spoIIIJ-associated protein
MKKGRVAHPFRLYRKGWDVNRSQSKQPPLTIPTERTLSLRKDLLFARNGKMKRKTVARHPQRCYRRSTPTRREKNGMQALTDKRLTDLTGARARIAHLLDLLNTQAGLRLIATITEAAPQPADQPQPEISVDLSGPDTPMLLARNAELLHAIEHIAAKILRLEPEEHDRISFDAAHFKANRDRQLRRSAETAIAAVRAEGCPYTFPPMSSRERRLLHLAIAPSGLRSASTGEGPRRSVVLYPPTHSPTV